MGQTRSDETDGEMSRMEGREQRGEGWSREPVIYRGEGRERTPPQCQGRHEREDRV